MSNFFRDSSLGFKPRANIFNKFKSKENASTKSPNPEFNNPPGNISLTDDDSDSSITNTLMLISNNSTVTGSQTTQHTADSSIVQGNGKNTFDSSSTPKNNTIKKIIEQTKSHRESTDDDDFEITEVRNVEEQKRNTFLPSNSNYTTGNQISVRHNSIVSPMNEEDSSSSSSNDVLLVAFTNTQKICSNLKQELQAQQSENTKLKVKINTYENDISKINIKVESFKKLLVELEGKSKKLISHKETDDDQIKLLTKEYDISKQKISGYRDDLMSLRALLNTIQANKRESEMELTKKAKEIEYLKRELDDCSGQLSEEKIRNGTLSHELETFKNEIITQLKDLTKLTQHDLIENLLQNKTEVCENISKTVKDVLKQDSNILLERFSETILTLTEKIESSTQFILNITKGAESTTINEFTNMINLSNSIKQDLLNNCEDVRTIILDEISTGNKTSVELIDTTSSEVTQKVEKLTIQLQNLESQIRDYQEKLTQSKEYEQIAKDLEKEICTLQQQINENMAIIGAKEAQYEEKCTTINSNVFELSKCKDELDKLTSTLKQNNLKLEKYEQDVAHYKGLLETEKANFENKFTSQSEINIAVTSENETLKQRIKELESYKNTWEKEQDNKLDKFQKINDQFQRLNVESVQLKAHELELEEENRNLKKTIEINDEAHEENTKELNQLKKQVLLHSTEKQGLTAEKLTLQDSNDELQVINNKLRRELEVLNSKVKTLQTDKSNYGEVLFEDNGNFRDSGLEIERPDSFLLQTQVPQPSVNRKATKSNKSVKQGSGKKTKTGKEKGVETVKNIERHEKRKPSEDEFDLTTSSNDDLELTNSSPLYVRPINTKIKTNSKKDSRKKLLLVDDFDMDGLSMKKTNPNKKRKR